MDRQALVDEIVDYFNASDHWRRLLSLLQDPDPRGSHVHTYVHTSVHPESLELILRRYFDMVGAPIVRRINWIRPRPNVGALHGIEPRGRLHFDFHYIFNDGVGLRPADGVENGSNLLHWDRHYIEDFNSQFSFRSVGPGEAGALRRYFSSEHWEEGLRIAARDDAPHMHINVETSVHPDAVAHYALDALDERGWEVYYVCPNAFLLGDGYTGKLVFMGKNPEKVYDIGWKYNPDVTIKATEVAWMFPELIGYDVMTTQMTEEELGLHPYVKLTTDEISRILDACHR